MCGIFGYISTLSIPNEQKLKILREFYKLRHRGPDELASLWLDDDKMMFGFMRLAIRGIKSGSQPMVYRDLVVMCNGEIYNYRELESELKSKHDDKFNSASDCEVIGPLFDYIERDIKELCRRLDGEFSLVIYDRSSKKIYYGVDELSIRPLFIGSRGTSVKPYSTGIMFSSELCAIDKLANTIERVEGGCCGMVNCQTLGSAKYRYFKFNKPNSLKFGYQAATKRLRELLIANVKAKLQTDREFAFLLSGGIDSSLVAGIATQILRTTNPNYRIHTFTVGFDKTAPDILAARKVAKYLNTHHHEVIFDTSDGIQALKSTVYGLGTYDQTTIRASVPQILLTAYIRKNFPNIYVLFVGDVADELFGSYLYFRNAPSSLEARMESTRLLTDIHQFDGLRMDRVCSANSFEARFVFFNSELLRFISGLPPSFTDCRTDGINKGVEKRILRDAFADTNTIPDEILNRVKHATSDATSTKSGWKDCIKKFAQLQISDTQFITESKKYSHNPPQTKEDLLYRMYFHKYYSPMAAKTIGYKWLPRWSGDVSESSATVLDIFEETAFE